MSSEDQLTPLDKEIGMRLSGRPRGTCLQAPELVELSVHGARSPAYDVRMAHIVTCASCRSLLRQFQERERARSARRFGSPTWLSNPRRRWVTVGSLAVVVVLAMLVGRFVPGPARTVVSLQDAVGTIRLTAGEELSGLPNMETAQKTLIVAALRTGHLPTPAVVASLHAPDGSRTEVAAFPVRGPVATVIATTQPEFTWTMPAGAVACRIEVATITDPQVTVMSKPLKAEHWKPKKPLSRGQIYRWQVIALDRSGNEIARVPQQRGRARFKVLEKDHAATLERARVTLGRSHLAMGVLYVAAGMLDDAAREFRALSQANADSAVVRRLRDSLRRMRG
jgi:hypothetical protein